jgi:hypothetical protein
MVLLLRAAQSTCIMSRRMCNMTVLSESYRIIVSSVVLSLDI